MRPPCADDSSHRRQLLVRQRRIHSLAPVLLTYPFCLPQSLPYRRFSKPVHALAQTVRDITRPGGGM